MSATRSDPSSPTDPTGSSEPPEVVRRRRAARPAGARRLDSTGLIYLVLVGVVVVSAVLTAVQGRNFFSQGNVWAVLTAMSVLGLIAIGQTLVILAGSLDLSVPYVVSLATLVAAYLRHRRDLARSCSKPFLQLIDTAHAVVSDEVRRRRTLVRDRH